MPIDHQKQIMTKSTITDQKSTKKSENYTKTESKKLDRKFISFFRLHFHQQYSSMGQVVRGCAPSAHAVLQVAKRMPNGEVKIYAVRNFIIRECSCINIFVC